MKTFKDVVYTFLGKTAKLLEIEQEVHEVFDHYDDDTCPYLKRDTSDKGEGSVTSIKLS